MNEQQIANIITKIETQLLESKDTISMIINRTADIQLVEKIGYYTYGGRIKDAFRNKHGKAMAPWREERTGIPDQKYKSMDVERQLYPSIQLAKKLMVNTQFTQSTIGKLANVTPGQILTYLKREGSGTGKTFRKEHASDTNVYLAQPATRNRIWVDRDLRSVTTASGQGKVIHTRKGVEGKAVLSVSIVGLSFTIARVLDDRIAEQRIRLQDTLLIKTGFLTGTAETVTSSKPSTFVVTLPYGGHANVIASYDLEKNTLTIELDNRNSPRNVSFTMLVTETDL